MLDNLIFYQNPAIFVIIVLVLLALSVELPYRYGRRLVHDPRVQDDIWNVLYAGLLALVAFMLGLSYAQAQGRFDVRRELVVREADATGVTWRRAVQLPQMQASEFRTILSRYTRGRLEAYDRPWDRTAFEAALKSSDVERERMWRIASDGLRAHPTNLGISLLVQALDDLTDLADDEHAALTQHIPTSVILFTVLLVILGAIFTGFSFARKQGRPGIFSVIYVLALTLVIQMIVDLDRPQSGLIRVSLEPLRDQIAIMESVP